MYKSDITLPYFGKLTLSRGNEGGEEEVGDISNSPNTLGSNKKLSEEQNKQVYILSKTYEGILDELGQLEVQQGKIFEQKVEYIQDLARVLEKLYRLYGQEEQINTISSTIIASINKRKYAISNDTVYYALDGKYKRDYNKTAETITTDSKKEEVAKSELELAMQNCIQKANSVLGVSDAEQANRKSNDELSNEELRARLNGVGTTKRELRRLNRVANDQEEGLMEEAEKRGIPIDPEIFGDEKDDVVSAESLLSGYSRYAKKEEEYIELRKRILTKIIKYKPLTDQQANDLADIMDLQIELDKPLADEKYRADIIQWLINGANEVAAGKHASAEMYKYVVPKKTLKELREMGEDVIKIATDPEGHPHIEFDERAIVREQVGDVKEAMERLAARILMSFPKYIATHSWFVTHPGWSIAKRAYDARGKLSAAA